MLLHLSSLAALLALFAPGSHADQVGLQCFVPGECLDSQMLSLSYNTTAKECLLYCKNTISCEWWTFYETSGVCVALSGCLNLNTTLCDDCISGEDQCPDAQCGVPGRCLGALEGVVSSHGEEDCHKSCQERDHCLWHTYAPQDQACFLTHDCPVMDKSCASCKSWERSCINADAGTMTEP